MKKLSGFLLLTITLVLCITFFTAGTVKSISKENAKLEEAYYQELEKNYLSEMKAYLNGRGFYNSGITMTRTDTQEGRREYRILIHNSRLERLSGAEKEEMKEDLKAIYSGMEECGFCHEFLGTDL